MSPSPTSPHLPFFNVCSFGAAGDGQTLETAAIQAAIEACSQAGGGTVYLPAGRYLTGSIFLRSCITLHIDAGAVLLGSQDMADYPVTPGRWEGASQLAHAPLVGGSGLRNIAVTGRGTIDGQGALWWRMQRERTLQYPRPRLVSFEQCENVLISGITATNSPSWTISPLRCDNVTIDGITVINPHDSPNTDGINPDSCTNVRIANCYIDVGDDCVTIKSGTEKDAARGLSACQNITVTNCTMAHGHGGVVIGSEMSGDVRNVVISNCVFTGTDRGIRLKSRRGRGGVVEDIRATNIVMDNVLCPFTMNLYYAPGAWGNREIADRQPHPVTSATPRFRRVSLSHITAREVKLAAAFLFGLAEMPVEQVSLSDVSISMAQTAEAGYPEMADDLPLMQQSGLWACNTRGLRLERVSIEGQLGSAFVLSDSADVELSAISGSGSPSILMRNVSGAFIHGCQASPESTFLRLEGSRTNEIILIANHLSRAAQAMDVASDVPTGAVITEL